MSRRKREQHGETKTKLFRKWTSMNNRVSPNWKGRKHYYDKGITVCDQWKLFSEFKNWAVNNGYRPDLELDRIDNNKGYYPENCRFVPKIINTSNRSNTVIVSYKGENISLTILRERYSWPLNQYNTIRRRIKNGWDHTEAIETPVREGTYGHKGPLRVANKSTGQVYDSVSIAAKDHGITPSKLSEMLSGKRRNKTPLCISHDQG